MHFSNIYSLKFYFSCNLQSELLIECAIIHLNMVAVKFCLTFQMMVKYLLVLV